MRAFSGERHTDAPVRLVVNVLATPAASVAALGALWIAEQTLAWAEDDGELRTATLTGVAPPEVVARGPEWTKVALVGTRSYALGEETVEYTIQTDAAWGTFDVPGAGEDDVPGDIDVPALTAIRATYAQAVLMAAFGIKPDPGASFDPLDDYSGVADATAFGGEKSAALTMTGAWQDIAAPPNIDTGDNLGRHLLLARVQNTVADETTTDYRGTSAVTGNALGVTTTVNGDAVEATLKTGEGFEVVNLGEFNVPAGAVPVAQSGSGQSAEAAEITQSVDEGTSTWTGRRIGDTSRPRYVGPWIVQSFAGFDGFVTAFEFEVDAVPTATTGWTLWLYTYPGGALSVELAEVSGITIGSTGTKKVSLASPVAVSAGTNYCFFLYGPGELSPGLGLAYADEEYAGGECRTLQPDAVAYSNTSVAPDLKFKVYGTTALGFNSAVGVEATSSESSKSAYVDVTQRIPIEFGALLFAYTTAANQGVYVDNFQVLASRRNVYLADQDGIAASILAYCKRWGHVMCWPQVTNTLVSAAYTPANAAPGNASFTITCRGRHTRLGSVRP